ncbi:MAG TPA: DUF362 domain-containing protein [Candidatus Deferrimicrobium sp.]|nr:DUF362 domain-containing protein [Candidatus Deferrimicrobium sp.]
MKPEVFIKPTGSILIDDVRACFNAFGGVESIVKESGKVFVKLNLTMPEPSAITTPEVVLSTIQVLKEANIDPKNIYVFDNCAVGFCTRFSFAVDNLGKRIRKLGAKPVCLDEQKSIDVEFKGLALDKPIPIPKILYDNLIEKREENTYINIPKLKTHLQTGLTNCIKNQHGLLYDNEKVYNHHLIDEKVVEILSKFRPDFNIVDALTVVDYGQVAILPEWNIPMGLLLAGRDPVAVDTVGAALLGIKEVKHIDLAAEQGLGCNDLNKINILPSKDLIDQYKMQLHCQSIPLKSSEKITFIKGKEKVCRTGCLTIGLYFIIFTHDTNYGPCVGVIGKGHDTAELDQYPGPFIVNGPCAVSELRDYFETRKKKEKIKVAYIEDHCNLAELTKYVRSCAQVPLSALSTLTPISLLKLMGLLIWAKLHRVRCQFKF